MTAAHFVFLTVGAVIGWIVTMGYLTTTVRRQVQTHERECPVCGPYGSEAP